MVSTNDVRPGMALHLEEGLFQIVEYQHVKPGKGKAFVRMRLKSLESGAVLDRTFRADEDVPLAVIERREHQFLYRDELAFHFMDTESYHQLTMTPEEVGQAADYLVESAVAVLPMYQDRPIGVELAASVELKVVAAEPGVKGDTVSGATKAVTVETGITVQVPLFVEQGDRIKVDTRTGAYMTRV